MRLATRDKHVLHAQEDGDEGKRENVDEGVRHALKERALLVLRHRSG